MAIRTHFIIERKTPGSQWDTFAFPKNDLTEARRVLAALREAENQKVFKGELRLVRETREYLDD